MAQEAQNGNLSNEGQGAFKGVGGVTIQLPITTPKPASNSNPDASIITNPNPANPSFGNNQITTIEFEKQEGIDKITSEYILSKYNNSKDGLFFNTKGDVVNEKGEVLYTKDKYTEEVNSIKESNKNNASKYIKTLETITLADGKQATVNANGELIDSNNKVVMTKDQLIQYVIDNVDIDNTPEGESLPEIVSKLSGYSIVDEHGKPVLFEDTYEGMAKRDKMLVEQEATRIANEKYNSIISSIPGIEDAINYAKINGSLDGFGVIKSYDTIKLDPNNTTQHFNVIVENEMQLGKSQEEAVEIANLYKDNDKLIEKGKLALDSLKKRSNDFRTKLANDAAEVELEYERNIAEQTNNIANIINSGKILNFSIPEVIKIKDDNGVIKSVNRQQFIDYVTKRTYQGKYTAEQVDAAKEPLDRKVLFALLRFTKVDLTQLVSNMADDKLVKKYRAEQRNLSLGTNRHLNINPNNSTNTGTPIIKTNLGARSTYNTVD